MHAGIFIRDYAKNMTSKKDNSGTSMNQMELLRTKGTRFCLWNVKIQCDTKIESRWPDRKKENQEGS